MRHDVIIIGGSFAGLAAALYVARARRSVCMIDTGSPRNRFATHSHGFLTHDGSDPATMLAIARSQVARYPTVTFVEDEAVGATHEAEGFSVQLAGGAVLESAKLILAFGISDELPDIAGLAERWGRSVLHCPYCHGYEFSGQRLGVLNLSPHSAQQAMLVAEWGPTTLYLNGGAPPDDALLGQLHTRGIAIEAAPVAGLRGEGAQLSAIELTDGRFSPIDALYIGPRNHLNSGIAQQLGCELEDAPLGQMIRTDSLRLTTVPGVYAAGDITRALHSVTLAAADGVTAGMAVHRALVF